jgi:hypothetical protein
MPCSCYYSKTIIGVAGFSCFSLFGERSSSSAGQSQLQSGPLDPSLSAPCATMSGLSAWLYPLVFSTTYPKQKNSAAPCSQVPGLPDGMCSTARPQLTAFFTSSPILASSAAVNSFSAKATGHRAPSSRFALSLKPNVAYRVLNLCAGWKKQTTLPSLA